MSKKTFYAVDRKEFDVEVQGLLITLTIRDFYGDLSVIFDANILFNVALFSYLNLINDSIGLYIDMFKYFIKVSNPFRKNV